MVGVSRTGTSRGWAQPQEAKFADQNVASFAVNVHLKGRHIPCVRSPKAAQVVGCPRPFVGWASTQPTFALRRCDAGTRVRTLVTPRRASSRLAILQRALTRCSNYAAPERGAQQIYGAVLPSSRALTSSCSCV